MRRGGTLGLAAAVVLSACPKTSYWDAKPVTDGASYLEAYTVALCNWAVRCEQFPDSMKDRCPELLQWEASLSVTTGAQAFDLEAAKACLASIDAAACSSGYPRVAEQCQKVFKASRADGETCYWSADCLSGDCDVAGCSGKCLPLRKVGETCGWYHDRCDPAPPMAGCCIPSSATTGTCAAVVPVGSPCGEVDACQFCDPDLAQCVGGTCVGLGVEGSPCDQPTTAPCGKGLYCPWEKEASACRKTLAEGQACGSSGPAEQCGELVCISGRCLQREPKVGESCVYGQTCAGGGRCLEGTCTDQPLDAAKPGDIGDSCKNGCRMLLICKEGGTCGEYPGTGEVCRDGDVHIGCRPGLVCGADSKCTAPLGIGSACSDGSVCASKNCAGGVCAEACAP